MFRKLVIAVLLFSGKMLSAQDDVKYIKLLKERTPLQMVSYHLTAVKDDRADTATIGFLHTGLSGKKNTLLKLYPATHRAVSEFIQTNYKQDTSTTAVQLHITNLKVDHSRNGFKNHLEVSFGVTFYINGEKVTDYEGAGSSDGAGDPVKPAEEMIRKNLENSLSKFDSWWQKNKAAFLASKGAPTTIIVEPVMATASTDADQILYSPNRQLTYGDFLAEPDKISRAVAATYSGIQMRLSSLTKDGTAKVRVEIVPYFDKNHSWFRNASRNAKTLLHEQKHFDLTAVKACELLQMVKSFTFTADYANELDALHKKNDTDWDLMQKYYDNETNHGQHNANQQKWNKLIADKLSECPCYK